MAPRADGGGEDFVAAWEAVNAELEARMAAAFAPAGAWQERVRAALEAGLRFLAANRDVARMYLTDVFFEGEQARQRRHQAMECLVTMIDRGREGAPSGERMTRTVAEGVVGGIWFTLNHLVEAGRGGELAEVLPELMYFVVLPYRGIEAARMEMDRSPPG